MFIQSSSKCKLSILLPGLQYIYYSRLSNINILAAYGASPGSHFLCINNMLSLSSLFLSQPTFIHTYTFSIGLLGSPQFWDRAHVTLHRRPFARPTLRLPCCVYECQDFTEPQVSHKYVDFMHQKTNKSRVFNFHKIPLLRCKWKMSQDERQYKRRRKFSATNPTVPPLLSFCLLFFT